MYERLSRFDTQPGDIKLPPLGAYPSEPVWPLKMWTVRFEADGGDWERPWRWESHVWAFSSTDAVARARAEFYGNWASYEDRVRLPLRVLAVLQEAV